MSLANVAQALRYFPMEDDQGKTFDFWDLNSLTVNPEHWNTLIANIAEKYQGKPIDVMVALDARGFMVAGALTPMLGVGFISARKPGKLPGKTISVNYGLEYRSDSTMQLQDEDYIKPGMNVLIVDDVLATGGSAEAACQLVEQLGATVAGIAVAIEIPALGGRGKLLQYEVTSELMIRDKQVTLHRNENLPASTGQTRLCVDPLVIDQSTGEFLLVERLNEPRGLAMAGGGIEGSESVVATIIREIDEELGLTVTADQIKFSCTLAGADRDPRGDQASYVCQVICDTKEARGEEGKTEPRLMSANILSLVTPPQFAFDDHAKLLTYEANLALTKLAS